jgi:hypothetical protein
MEIDGNPGGAIYLDKGHITFARSSWSPNLTARLSGILRPNAEVRELLLSGDRPERDLGSQLIVRSYLTEDRLHAILRSLVVDAIMVLTVPLAEEATIAGIRFESAKKHWAESFCRLPVHMVRREAIGRGERLASCGLADTANLELRDLPGARSVLRREQWAIACKINGKSSARDLAWRCGFTLYDTVEQVAGLVRAGLCVPRPVSGQAAQRAAQHRRQARAGAAPGTGCGFASPGADVPAGELPVRAVSAEPGAAGRLGAVRADVPETMPSRTGPAERGQQGMPQPGVPQPGVPQHEVPQFTPVPAESLQRVLDGLRRLS